MNGRQFPVAISRDSVFCTILARDKKIFAAHTILPTKNLYLKFIIVRVDWNRHLDRS